MISAELIMVLKQDVEMDLRLVSDANNYSSVHIVFQAKSQEHTFFG